MKSVCEGNVCETETKKQPTAEECCPTTSGCSDPIEKSMGLWVQSFFQAMKETQVDILKSKIQKSWGTQMDRVADSVLESMGTVWQSMLAQSEAKSSLRENLDRIFKEGKPRK